MDSRRSGFLCLRPSIYIVAITCGPRLRIKSHTLSGKLHDLERIRRHPYSAARRAGRQYQPSGSVLRKICFAFLKEASRALGRERNIDGFIDILTVGPIKHPDWRPDPRSRRDPPCHPAGAAQAGLWLYSREPVWRARLRAPGSPAREAETAGEPASPSQPSRTARPRLREDGRINPGTLTFTSLILKTSLPSSHENV